MNYFVVGADGTKYGPADISTLNLWIADARLSPMMEVEEEGTGRRMQAKDVFGLSFPNPNMPPQQQMGSQNPVPSYYYRPQQSASNEGGTELAIAWVLGIIGLFVCPVVISSLGIYLAYQAKKKGNPSAQAAMIFCIVSLIAGMVFGAIIGYQNAQRIFGQ